MCCIPSPGSATNLLVKIQHQGDGYGRLHFPMTRTSHCAASMWPMESGCRWGWLTWVLTLLVSCPLKLSMSLQVIQKSPRCFHSRTWVMFLHSYCLLRTHLLVFKNFFKMCLVGWSFVSGRAGSLLLCGPFSGGSWWGIPSSCVRASHCGGSSSCGAGSRAHRISSCGPGLRSRGPRALERPLNGCDPWI